MRLRQYVYFGLASDVVSPAEITSAVGADPDEISVRGSKRTDPPRPASHSWMLRCDKPGLTVDDQIQDVLQRVRPLADKIRDLTTRTDVVAVLQIVRDFDAEDGEEESHDDLDLPAGERLTTFLGQHQLLGWHLEADTLAFLASLGADIDCDEYGG